jgi:hypothetical protein
MGRFRWIAPNVTVHKVCILEHAITNVPKVFIRIMEIVRVVIRIVWNARGMEIDNQCYFFYL